jgi:hypothetical protein
LPRRGESWRTRPGREGVPAAIQEEVEERERDGGSWEVQGEETSGGLSFRNLYRDFPFSTGTSTKFADLFFGYKEKRKSLGLV